MPHISSPKIALKGVNHAYASSFRACFSVDEVNDCVMMIPKETDIARFASEFLRAIRGERSQVSLSRRLGYKSNVAYRWECGRAFPTAARAFRAYDQLCGSTKAALTTFFGKTPSWVERTPPTTAPGIVALIAEFRGRTPITDLAEQSGFSRFRLSRWIHGTAEPSLPELLGVIHALSPRLPDFLVSFFKAERLPTVAAYWKQLEASRRAAYEEPWSHVVLRCLELSAYRSGAAVSLDGSDATAKWIAGCTGIAEEKVSSGLGLLELGGLVRNRNGKWEPTQVQAVDTRNYPGQSQGLKLWWLQQAANHLEAQREGLFSYLLFSVSHEDLERIEQVQRRCYREISAIVASSQPAECVGLFSAQLLRLDRDVSTLGNEE